MTRPQGLPQEKHSFHHFGRGEECLKMLHAVLLWAHPDSNQGPTGYEPAALPPS